MEVQPKDLSFINQLWSKFSSKLVSCLPFTILHGKPVWQQFLKRKYLTANPSLSLYIAQKPVHICSEETNNSPSTKFLICKTSNHNNCDNFVVSFLIAWQCDNEKKLTMKNCDYSYSQSGCTHMSPHKNNKKDYIQLIWIIKKQFLNLTESINSIRRADCSWISIHQTPGVKWSNLLKTQSKVSFPCLTLSQ